MWPTILDTLGALAVLASVAAQIAFIRKTRQSANREARPQSARRKPFR
ncbi:hypothetical protein OI25_3693 [Paraburkholderia fungorum]|jgi:hypothetical protein|uniref:Uncharacterized protein n=1 Tax=Paraburkholderia fungorum TaxID=134537 RepID=A0AAU8TA34_9BURK|nr:hypothetical protein [Paraburkholderia fungorum]AJZ60607.1 hypothetical protein OI25_3693 [Paraburkholderia fungorum]MBB5543441.1 heme exporter protein D [Paraburkholderia fungorum]